MKYEVFWASFPSDEFQYEAGSFKAEYSDKTTENEIKKICLARLKKKFPKRSDVDWNIMVRRILY